MVSVIRRMFVVGVRHGFSLVLAFLVFGLGLTLLKAGPVQADESADRWKKVALSGVGLDQRLMALNELRKVGGEAAAQALADVAASGKLPAAAAACAQLGQMHSSCSKARLKAVLENGSLDATRRGAAAVCIAEHWKDQGDVSYLESHCEGNAALEAQCSRLRTVVYGLEQE